MNLPRKEHSMTTLTALRALCITAGITPPMIAATNSTILAWVMTMDRNADPGSMDREELIAVALCIIGDGGEA
jgi:hypothetical protein